MATLNLKAGDNITLTKSGEDLEISSNQEETSEIIVSPTEPNTGEEVWIQKGKNLFDGNLIKGAYLYDGSGYKPQEYFVNQMYMCSAKKFLL